jgi:hypothetical protein
MQPCSQTAARPRPEPVAEGTADTAQTAPETAAGISPDGKEMNRAAFALPACPDRRGQEAVPSDQQGRFYWAGLLKEKRAFSVYFFSENFFSENFFSEKAQTDWTKEAVFLFFMGSRHPALTMTDPFLSSQTDRSMISERFLSFFRRTCPIGR